MESHKVIEVWSDYVCPFCYLEEPVLNQITLDFPDQVSIRWRAFELRPDPVPTLDPKGDYLERVWKSSVYPMASQRRMALRLPPVQPRSRQAFIAAEFARSKGKFDEMHRALFQAFFEFGEDISQPAVLARIAKKIGLNSKELQGALNSKELEQAVLQDQELAHGLGISGVPAMVIHSADQPLESGILVSGAQPYEVVRAALEREWSDAENMA